MCYLAWKPKMMHLAVIYTLFHLVIAKHAVESGVRCKLITTDDLLQVDYSRNREVGSYAAFHCPVPGKRSGVSLTRCLENGTWADPTPTCESGCQVPRIIGGSIIEESFGDWYWNWSLFRYEKVRNYTKIQPGSIVHSGKILRFTCDKPLSVDGNGTESLQVECVSGKWSTELQCQEFLQGRCYASELKNKTHVSTISHSVTLSGNRLKVVCDEGYSPVSKLMPLCLNGLWQSDNESLCEESKCQIPRIVRGSVKEEILGEWYWNWSLFRYEQSLDYITKQPRSFISSGKMLWFYCNKPFSVQGNGRERVQINCVRGTWSTKLQCLLDGERFITTTESSNFNRITSAPYTTTVKYLSSSTQSTVKFEWTSPASIDEPKPDILVTSLPSQETPKEECFCEYSLEDSNIVAHADGRQLINGDRVRKGSLVVFHCLRVGYYRFKGHREITCSNCQPWHHDEFPTCSAPKKGDAAILFGKEINVLPGGNIEIDKGKSVNLTCVAMETAVYPDWTAPDSPGISFLEERRVRQNYGDVVYLTHLKILNADYDHEGSYECSVNGNHKAVLQVVITDPNLRCPKLPEDGSVIMRYDMERREHSKVSFSCSQKGQELVGRPELTCLRSGQWSDTPPQCSVPGCTVKDLLASVPKNVVPLMDNTNKSPIPYNSTVKLTCGNDMVAVGNPEAKCGDERKWKIDSVECKRLFENGTNIQLNAHLSSKDSGVRCELIKTDDLLQIEYSQNREVGSYAAFHCPIPGERSGVSLTRCLENGTWADRTPTCKSIPACNLDLDPLSNLRVHPMKENYGFGESVILSCPIGKIMLPREVQRILCLGSTWSDTFPTDCI